MNIMKGEQIMKRIVSLLISIYLLPNIFTSPGEVSLPGDLLRQVP